MTKEFAFASLPSPVGVIRLVFDEARVVRALDFADHDARMHRLLTKHYGPVTLVDAALPSTIETPLKAYFDGELGALDDLATETTGTDFQRLVWQGLRQIPAGTTWSYGRLAALIGKPKAVRAVGLANGANPLALVVPCHRVIGANGTLTGYGGGLERKRWLLAHEGAWSKEGLNL
ncbi:MAG: methylated-DNA--[protein]-cysteine S-methyltransferase [Pseudomonadota bacterium]